MKNVVYIIVDAFCYNNLNLKIGNEYVTPFLKKLANTGISYDNIYSQAPYTEASQVTLLSGENCLDGGGYLFGNGNVKSSLFEEYKKMGYQTIFSYSPYVFTSSYLRGVTKYYYTRLYSIEPLLFYRMDYFRAAYLRNGLKDEELDTCIILLTSGLKEWEKQIEDILENRDSCKAIEQFIPDKRIVKNVHEGLLDEINKCNNNAKEYIYKLFDNWDNATIRKLSKEYNSVRTFSLTEENKKLYQNELERYQKKINRIIRRHGVEFSYLIPMLWRNKNGFDDFKHTCMNYYRHYTTPCLRNYLTNLDSDYKVEASMQRMFEAFYSSIDSCDKNNINYFAHIHLQDFHLPSVFHSVDIDDAEMIKHEFSKAFELLDKIDGDFKGNIMSLLSAHYCDLKLEEFFLKLRREMKNDFLFVVTADHGYPCYDTPPRPMVYNQTYTEAFHIPFIMYNSTIERKESISSFYSNMDSVEILERHAFENDKSIPSRKYILCEYGGPGCPIISQKPIWYTYIDEKYRVSVECCLGNEITYKNVKSVFDLQSDPNQKRDLVKKNIPIQHVLREINKRHDWLSQHYGREDYISILISDLDDKTI